MTGTIISLVMFIASLFAIAMTSGDLQMFMVAFAFVCLFVCAACQIFLIFRKEPEEENYHTWKR